MGIYHDGRLGIAQPGSFVLGGIKAYSLTFTAAVSFHGTVPKRPSRAIAARLSFSGGVTHKVFVVVVNAMRVTSRQLLRRVMERTFIHSVDK
jgi:hypothetical protein